MKSPEMGKEAYALRLSGEKTRQNHLDDFLAGKMGGKNVGTPIHMSSLSGGFVFPFVTLYSASKMALEALAEGYHYELAPLGIESIIIEPGLFPTGLLTSQQGPGDQERLIEYGSLNHIPVQILRDTEAANNGSAASDPQLVADLIADLIAQSRGTRPFRTIIGNDPGLAPLNVAKAHAQQKVLDALGLTTALAFKVPNKDS